VPSASPSSLVVVETNVKGVFDLLEGSVKVRIRRSIVDRIAADDEKSLDVPSA
jgi:hypothetical protein